MSEIKLYNADCMDIMKTMADKSVDLCLCDPPYGIGADKGVGGAYKKGENTRVIGMCDLLKNILMKC